MPLPASFRSVDEIVAAALSALNNDSPTEADRDYAASRYAELYDELNDQGIADWPSAATPLRAAGGVIALLAARCERRFTGADELTAIASEVVAWKRLYAAIAEPASVLPVRAEYF